MLAWYHLAVRRIFRRQSKEKESGREDDMQKGCPKLAMEDTVGKTGQRKQLWRQGG